jgi:hypothetical protein
VGVAYQQTNRKSESSFEQIGLNSITLNAGVELEVIKDLYILGNLFMLNSEGNETLPVRNSEGTIINFQNYSISGNETNISGGLRFDFSGDVYLAAIFESNKNRFSSNVAYQYNQLMIYYIMKF